MDRFNYNIGHYNSPAYQESGQHTSQPETGQTSGGVPASGPSGSQPVPSQPYLSPNLPAQIPSSPGFDWEYLVQTPQPIAMEELILPQFEAGQTSGGIAAASGSSWSYPAPGQTQSYQDFNMPAQTSSWPRPDWETPQPTTVADVIQNDAQPNPQSAVKTRRGRPRTGSSSAKERFLAGLEAFGRGVPLPHCSSSLRFRDYISDSGSMVRRGIPLYDELTAAERDQLNRAIAARQRAKLDTAAVQKHFLAGLNNYAWGVPLTECSASLQFKHYVTADGRLLDWGKDLYAGLSQRDQNRVNQALISRNEISSELPVEDDGTEERFLAGLDRYAQGFPLNDCSATLDFESYVSDEGKLQPLGRRLRDSLPQEDQTRLNRALSSRRQMYLRQSMKNTPAEARFLASLDRYAAGMPIAKCGEDIYLRSYLTADYSLTPQGQTLYNNLSQDDKDRVNWALTARREAITQRTSRELDQFMDTLGPYGRGLSLSKCGNESGMKNAVDYLTAKGGLTPRGKRLIEKLQPDQQYEVWYAIERRRQFKDPSAQVPESPWQMPEMSSSMPEMEGMSQAEMTDPIQTAMYNPMQTEAMMAAAWQYTGQAMPGTWSIPSESAQSSIPYYGSDAVGAGFQHRYDSNGLMPQRAPDRLIGRGIVHDTLINIQGEEYRVHDTGRRSVNPTNENPQGNIIMLVPRMRGG
ncbi:MAG: hypothetical protein P8X74_13310 [Reinekea sp.]